MRMKISGQYTERDHWKISKLPIPEKDKAENRGPSQESCEGTFEPRGWWD